MFSPYSNDDIERAENLSFLNSASAFTSSEDLNYSASSSTYLLTSHTSEASLISEEKSLNFNVDLEITKVIEMSRNFESFPRMPVHHYKEFFSLICKSFVYCLKTEVRIEIQCLEEFIIKTLDQNSLFSALCYRISDIFFDGPIFVTQKEDSPMPIVKDASTELSSNLKINFKFLNMEALKTLLIASAVDSPSKKAQMRLAKMKSKASLVQEESSIIEEEQANELSEAQITPKKTKQIVMTQLSELFFSNLAEQINLIISESFIRSTLTVFSQKIILTVPNEKEDLILRRMDSLSRLLSLSKELSVCSAVAVINNTIYISANNSSSKEGNVESNAHIKIINYLHQRMQQIKRFIKELTIVENMYNAEMSNYTVNYYGLLRQFYDEIYESGGTSFPEQVIYQAISKLCISLHNQQLPEEMSVALSNQTNIVVMTVAQISEMNTILLAVKTFNESSYNGMAGFLLKNQLTSPRPHDFHCEQLLYFYTRIVLQLDLKNIAFGISKKCCPTCYEILNAFQDVRLRGSHINFKPSVANILNGEQVVEQFPLENDSSVEPMTVPGSKRSTQTRESILSENSSCKTPTKKSKSAPKNSPFFSAQKNSENQGWNLNENTGSMNIGFFG